MPSFARTGGLARSSAAVLATAGLGALLVGGATPAAAASAPQICDHVGYAKFDEGQGNEVLPGLGTLEWTAHTVVYHPDPADGAIELCIKGGPEFAEGMILDADRPEYAWSARYDISHVGWRPAAPAPDAEPEPEPEADLVPQPESEPESEADSKPEPEAKVGAQSAPEPPPALEPAVEGETSEVVTSAEHAPEAQVGSAVEADLPEVAPPVRVRAGLASAADGSDAAAPGTGGLMIAAGALLTLLGGLISRRRLLGVRGR